MSTMFRNRPTTVYNAALTPKSDVPRSTFDRIFSHKTTFDAAYLVPFHVDEVLPGDTFDLRTTIFARMTTPLYPLMDNLRLSTFYFFVPNRLLWDNWVKMMGEQVNPGDSTSYTVPQITAPTGGYPVGALGDYMGLPTVGQIGASNTFTHSALPFRAYNKIYNDWFRDENLISSVYTNTSDSTDNLNTDPTKYVLQRRGKRKDYFTSALPWPQKANPVTIPLGSTAPVISTGPFNLKNGTYNTNIGSTAAGLASTVNYTGVDLNNLQYNSGLQVDLSTATAVTINALRVAFQMQRLFEKDARGGTRYTESLQMHFGVSNPDFRLQRSEYLGGGETPISVSPIAQTSASGVTGSGTPLGQLGAMATSLASGHGFSHSFTEHGFVIGIMCVTADLTYQQGLHKMWSRQTRFDHAYPVFAHLGEQTVLNKEIYMTGQQTQDDGVFGYMPRYDEYRFGQKRISGLFKSTSAGTLDGWHLAQKFAVLPTLNKTFIEEDPPLNRVLAVSSTVGKQFFMDSFTSCRSTRALPVSGVPGMIDHF